MAEPARKPKVYIVIYTLYHHIYKLSLAIRDGLEQSGIDAQLFQVPETLSEQVLEKMHAPAKPDLPIIEASQLVEADGLFFGIPTRFGIFPAQMKALLDSTGQLWAKGSLAGKFVATFFSTASQHGGQETTALNAVTYFAHHGLMYVPFGFANASMFSNDEVIGGSAYGAGTITNGDGSREPSATELAIAKNQAENFAAILKTYCKGRQSNAADPDASIRSLRGSSTAGVTNGTVGGASSVNNKEPPIITTTTPEGQTEEQHEAATSGAAAGSATAAGAGAAAGTELKTERGQTEPSAQQSAATPAANRPGPTQDKRKKKKKGFWFCCGSADQLD